MPAIIEMMRPKQWIKNLLVFAALIFTANLFNGPFFITTLLAFIVFCCASSSVYLYNDILDIESDKKHPLKAKRPLARGAVSRELAGLTSIVLAGFALGGAFWLSNAFGIVIILYLVLFGLYGLFLKHVVILDVFTIALGFVLRAVSGAVVLSVLISPWLLICTILLSLFLGLAKRRNELLLLTDKARHHRGILEEYTVGLLDQMISVVASATVVTYSLYTFTSETGSRHHLLMLTVPFVLFGIFRYLYLMHRKNLGGSPENVLLTDLWLMGNVVLWGICSATIILLSR